MKIMVFDVPAEFGGALTVLEQYYNTAVNDSENTWIFVVSKPEFKETENVKVLRLPWVKKSWFHRLWFDNFYAKKMVNKCKPDKIISLQNTSVKTSGYFQELYVHQALIFCEKRFSFRENKKFWIYQNIISRMITNSIKKVDSVVVQTKWMKDEIVRRTGSDEKKIQVIPPKIEVYPDLDYERTEEINFFYPAGDAVYKNHKVIYEAVRILKNKGYKDFNVILTIQKPHEDIEDLSDIIRFCGYMDKQKMMKSYKKSILLFPSYIESYGLPLLEARTYNCPVVASNCAFSREILEGYEKASYFEPFSSKQLSEKMEEHINNL